MSPSYLSRGLVQDCGEIPVRSPGLMQQSRCRFDIICDGRQALAELVESRRRFPAARLRRWRRRRTHAALPACRSARSAFEITDRLPRLPLPLPPPAGRLAPADADKFDCDQIHADFFCAVQGCIRPRPRHNGGRPGGENPLRTSRRGPRPAKRGGDFRQSAQCRCRRAGDLGRAVALLNERERGLLARIAMRVHFRRGATIYREGDPADFVYNIAAGVVKAFRTLTDGRQRIVAFLFAEDLIGLAEEGVYVNQAEAVTAVTAYRIPLRALDNLARTDPTLDYSLLLKLTHELRAAQCHALILARHDAVGRIAMFIAMLQRLQQERGVNGDEIRLPMSRSDIADYVGMPLSTVSRSFRSLIAGNIVRFTDRRHLRIIDRARFEELLSQPARGREAEPGRCRPRRCQPGV